MDKKTLSTSLDKLKKNFDSISKTAQKLYDVVEEEPESIIVEGNNGGDYFILTVLDRDCVGEDIIHLEVGHSCAKTFDIFLPVSILTYMLSNNFVDQKDLIEIFKEESNWPKELKRKLLIFADHYR